MKMKITNELDKAIKVAYVALGIVSAGEGLDKVLDYNNEKNTVFRYTYETLMERTDDYSIAYWNAAFTSEKMPKDTLIFGLCNLGVSGFLLGASAVMGNRKNISESRKDNIKQPLENTVKNDYL